MRRFLIGLGSIVALAAVVFFGIGFYLSPQSKLRSADAIVAISGGETAARTSTAVSLYKEHYSSRIIFSGAALDPNSPSNAATMAASAEQQGVPATDITLDPVATNTRQNATDVATIVKRQADHSIILVTSPYHQRRAAIVFSRALGKGVSIINHSSYDQAWRRSHWWATSYSRNLTFAEAKKTAYELLAGIKI